jgi:hypothetical protein
MRIAVLQRPPRSPALHWMGFPAVSDIAVLHASGWAPVAGGAVMWGDDQIVFWSGVCGAFNGKVV